MTQGMPELLLSVSEFVALLNQTLDYAYPSVVIQGELTEFRVSKNKWLYFNLRDEQSSVKFFGTVYQLPGPLEDGMLLKVRGQPRLHPRFGFSVNVQNIQPTGEGTIKKSAELLRAKLASEGLFDASRKRQLAYPPLSVGLVTSAQSAAYADFIKIVNKRWGDLEIYLADTQVQGEVAPQQLVTALEQINRLARPPEVIVVTRGGGSAEDLQAFNDERVVRAVAASRVPTLVAIGHETDTSLAELAADCRASTPSNAAETLVPDRQQVKAQLSQQKQQISRLVGARLELSRQHLQRAKIALDQRALHHYHQRATALAAKKQLLLALSPQSALRRGYAIVYKNRRVVRRGASLSPGDIVEVQLSDSKFAAEVKSSNIQDKESDQ